MAKKKDPLIDTAAIERAKRFDVAVFLGTGQFARAENLPDLATARARGAELVAQANNGRGAMIYAVTPEGRSIFVPHAYQPTPMKENDEMATKAASKAELSGQQIAQLTAIVTGGGFKRANSRDAAIKRFENVAAERGIKGTARILAASFDQAKVLIAESLKIAPAKANDTPAPIAKLGGKGKALAAVKGEPQAAPQPAKAAKAPKDAKPAGKRAAILEAAQAGKLPEVPDFSANTHKPHRKKLEAVVAMVKAGDVKGLKAFEINPISSSPKAIDKYRNLAVIALEAQAAKKKAAA